MPERGQGRAAGKRKGMERRTIRLHIAVHPYDSSEAWCIINLHYAFCSWITSDSDSHLGWYPVHTSKEAIEAQRNRPGPHTCTSKLGLLGEDSDSYRRV